MNTARLKVVERSVMRPVASKGRKTNKAYRTREHLTESEMAKLLASLATNRHGHRDWLIGLLIYRTASGYLRLVICAGMTLICPSAPLRFAG